MGPGSDNQCDVACEDKIIDNFKIMLKASFGYRVRDGEYNGKYEGYCPISERKASPDWSPEDESTYQELKSLYENMNGQAINNLNDDGRKRLATFKQLKVRRDEVTTSEILAIGEVTKSSEEASESASEGE